MAKNSPPPAPAIKSDPALWMSYALVGVCGVCLGIIGTYFALRPQLQRPAAQIISSEGTVPLEPGSLGGLPPAGLTAGQTPSQADRTLGNFYYDQSNWAQAIRYYESAIKQGADDADIRTDLGNAYQFSGQSAQALASYEQGQKMNPQHEFSLFNQGGLYFNAMHNPTKAIEVWNNYLVRFPNGQNVAAAQQLIAKAGGIPASVPAGARPVPAENQPVPAMPVAPAVDSTQERLFKLVSPAKPGKP